MQQQAAGKWKGLGQGLKNEYIPVKGKRGSIPQAPAYIISFFD
jgi:hypothetical protein